MKSVLCIIHVICFSRSLRLSIGVAAPTSNTCTVFDAETARSWVRILLEEWMFIRVFFYIVLCR
jgi:hypothetical protein